MLSCFRNNKGQDGLFCSCRARGWSAGLSEESRCRSSCLSDGTVFCYLEVWLVIINVFKLCSVIYDF